MTFERFKYFPSGKEIIEKEVDKKLNFPKESILALYYTQEKNKGPGSFFQSYFKTMPQSSDNFPIFYSEKELAMLEGTGMVELINME